MSRIRNIGILTSILLVLTMACACHQSQRKPYAEAAELVCPPQTKRVEDKTSSYPEFYCVGFDGREGKYLEFDAHGRIKTRANYVHDKMQGEWSSYHPDGALHTKGQMRDNMRVGAWNQYYVNGRLRSEKIYENSVLNGPVVLYYQSGSAMARGQFVNGLEEGNWQVFTPEGKLARECAMKRGKETDCTIHIKDFSPKTLVYDTGDRGDL